MTGRASGSEARSTDRPIVEVHDLLGRGQRLEEIPAGFPNALVLRAGQIVAAGPLAIVMSDEVLGRAFDLPIEMPHHDGRAWARM